MGIYIYSTTIISLIGLNTNFNIRQRSLIIKQFAVVTLIEDKAIFSHKVYINMFQSCVITSCDYSVPQVWFELIKTLDSFTHWVCSRKSTYSNTASAGNDTPCGGLIECFHLLSKDYFCNSTYEYNNEGAGPCFDMDYGDKLTIFYQEAHILLKKPYRTNRTFKENTDVFVGPHGRESQVYNTVCGTDSAEENDDPTLGYPENARHSSLEGNLSPRHLEQRCTITFVSI